MTVPRGRAAYAKQAIRDKLMEHKAYIARHGDDMPEITGWKWGQGAGASAGGPPFYQLLPADYPYPLIRVCSTQWGICAIPVTVRPGTPCQCLATNGSWVPGVCTH